MTSRFSLHPVTPRRTLPRRPPSSKQQCRILRMRFCLPVKERFQALSVPLGCAAAVGRFVLRRLLGRKREEEEGGCNVQGFEF